MEREKLKEALLKAYEAGWRGSLELKEGYAEEQTSALFLVDEVKSNATVNLPDVYTTGWSNRPTEQIRPIVNSTIIGTGEDGLNWISANNNWISESRDGVQEAAAELENLDRPIQEPEPTLPLGESWGIPEPQEEPF